MIHVNHKRKYVVRRRKYTSYSFCQHSIIIFTSDVNSYNKYYPAKIVSKYSVFIANHNGYRKYYRRTWSSQSMTLIRIIMIIQFNWYSIIIHNKNRLLNLIYRTFSFLKSIPNFNSKIANIFFSLPSSHYNVKTYMC